MMMQQQSVELPVPVSHIDERLTVDTPPASGMQQVHKHHHHHHSHHVRPLDEIVIRSNDEQYDDDDDDVSSVSFEEGDAVIPAASTSVVVPTKTSTTTPRSIFSKYWKENPQTAPTAATATDPIVRPSSPSCVMAGSSSAAVAAATNIKNNNNTYTYVYTGGKDPYEHFGIEQQQSQAQQVEDSSSLNTYERILGNCEDARRHHRDPLNDPKGGNSNAFSVWMSFFSGGNINNINTNETSTSSTNMRHSSPSLRTLNRSFNNIHNNNNNTRNGVQSDSALLKTPKKSCLRSGRFSITGNKSKSQVEEEEPSSSSSSSSSIRTDETVVQFNSQVEIRVFQPPVESWAANGWSNWFG